MSWNLLETLLSLARLFPSFWLSGYLIGYLVHRKEEEAPNCTAMVLDTEDPLPRSDNVIPLMDWSNVKNLLFQKVSAANFEPVLT